MTISDKLRQWEVICADSADGEFVIYVEGKKQIDNENFFCIDREEAIARFEIIAEHYRETNPKLYSGIYLFDEDNRLIRDYHFTD